MDSEKTLVEDNGIEAAAAKALETPRKSFVTDTKTYDPSRPYEINGPAGTIGVVRGHVNLQRIAGRGVAVSLSGMQVDNRTYEITWMSSMLREVTQSPGYLPGYCNGNIDKFLENLYEFEDLAHYYQEWESWRNSFRVSGPKN